MTRLTTASARFHHLSEVTALLNKGIIGLKKGALEMEGAPSLEEQLRLRVVVATQLEKFFEGDESDRAWAWVEAVAPQASRSSWADAARQLRNLGARLGEEEIGALEHIATTLDTARSRAFRELNSGR